MSAAEMLSAPISAGEVVDRLTWIANGLRAVRQTTAAPKTRNALARLIEETDGCRKALLRQSGEKRGPSSPQMARPQTPEGQPSWRRKNDPVSSTRHCPRHNDGDGAWLPISEFGTKSTSSTQLRFCCRGCYKTYQRERYVAANKRAIIVSIIDGDEIVGAVCNGCGKPFEIGQIISADRIRHQDCKFS